MLAITSTHNSDSKLSYLKLVDKLLAVYNACCAVHAQKTVAAQAQEFLYHIEHHDKLAKEQDTVSSRNHGRQGGIQIHELAGGRYDVLCRQSKAADVVLRRRRKFQIEKQKYWSILLFFITFQSLERT